ncbi:hippocalcin-like protein 4 isoform X2 [Clavelina lepadiformis]|uniref:hippocalcin-like protein 4 isoform X2 n=1 Tax=Clavelina lepadiformis TaxID=159417 RepID=UPI0040425967
MGHHKSKLSPEELTAIVNSTEFTEAEIRQWYKSFLKDCPSGILSKKEFKRSFDTNQNGTIDFREFMCALSVTARGTFDQKLKWAFRMYDRDNDGHVTKSEMEEMIKAIYKLIGDRRIQEVLPNRLTAQQRADQIFSKMDKDGDENITLEEFKIAVSQDPSLVLLFQDEKETPSNEEPKIKEESGAM